jgi:hypothetical protein
MGKKVNLYLDDDTLALWEQIPSGNRSALVKQMLRDYTKSTVVDKHQQKIRRYESELNMLSAKRSNIESEIAMKKEMLSNLRSSASDLKIDSQKFWDGLVKHARDAYASEDSHYSYTRKSQYKIHSVSGKRINIENIRTGRTNSNFTKDTVDLALQRLIDGGGKVRIGHFIPVKMHEYTVVALHSNLYEFDGFVYWSDVAMRPLPLDANIPHNRGQGLDGSQGVEYGDWEWIRVLVDNKPARCCTAQPGWGDKIIIEWDEPNPIWPEQFQTKYFRFDVPGKMAWGHHGEVMDMLEILD